MVLSNSVTSLNRPKDKADGTPNAKMARPIIHAHFFRFVTFPLEITDTIISNIENADVKAANKKTIKKAAKKNIPNGIWLKIVGSTLNKRTGPASGARPNEKTAGKIASPDNRTTITFIPTIDSAERGKLCCFGKYELYVIMTDTPTLNVKNDCPIAFKIVFDVIFEKSGRNKNSIPLMA